MGVYQTIGNNLVICLAGVCLDWIFGDPYWLYHPIRVIGNLITKLEALLRPMAKERENRLIVVGGVLWGMTVTLSTVIPFAVLYLAGRVWPGLAVGLEIFWCYQLLAAKSLVVESKKVYQELKKGDLNGARKAVSMIVGRDTQSLTAEGVTKAAVETVAENTSDGVIAPLFYMLIGGPVLGFTYKAINTMDSMIGYKNDKYLYFGRVAAKMDDFANYIPARLSAIFMIAGAKILNMNAANAYRIYKRDRKKHESPNAAQTESVCAGALEVQLAGDAWYFGKLHKKEFIGDGIRSIEPEDINRAGKLMLATEIITFLVIGAVRLVFCTFL